jgi:hypothetical protein
MSRKSFAVSLCSLGPCRTEVLSGMAISTPVLHFRPHESQSPSSRGSAAWQRLLRELSPEAAGPDWPMPRKTRRAFQRSRNSRRCFLDRNTLTGRQPCSSLWRRRRRHCPNHSQQSSERTRHSGRGLWRRRHRQSTRIRSVHPRRLAGEFTELLRCEILQVSRGGLLIRAKGNCTSLYPNAHQRGDGSWSEQIGTRGGNATGRHRGLPAIVLLRDECSAARANTRPEVEQSQGIRCGERRSGRPDKPIPGETRVKGRRVRAGRARRSRARRRCRFRPRTLMAGYGPPQGTSSTGTVSAAAALAGTVNTRWRIRSGVSAASR